MKMAVSSPKRYKTPWEKEILSMTSSFFFFNSVFKRLLQQTRKKDKGLFGKGLRLNTCIWILGDIEKKIYQPTAQEKNESV